MDVAALLEEYRHAQEEHARALAAAQRVRENLERAKAEYATARETEQQREREVAQATEVLTQELAALDVREETLRVAHSLVEFQANIGCYHCYLQVEGDRYASVSIDDLRVSVRFPRVVLQYKEIECWETEIEYNVDIAAATVAVHDDHVYLRLPVKDGDKPVTDPCSSFSRVTADELQPKSYGRLACRGCDHPLLTGSIDKALPLPSANWMEMMDFWGAGIGSFEHIPREGIFAQTGRVLVGEDHVLVHSSDVDAKAWQIVESKPILSTSQDEEDDDWVAIACSSCNSELGHRNREHETTLRLPKHRVSATVAEENDREHPDPPRNVFATYSSDSAVCAKLLLAAETDGIFRFRLTPSLMEDAPSSSLSVLRVQLLSWDTMLRATAANSTSFVRVLKVTYSTEDSTTQLTPELAACLPPSMQVQEIAVDGSVIDALYARLQATSELLPASQRAFNKMVVGYLYT
ncbi:hypothetical protein P43SY_010119 [Pythium insidiosum]|uniref:Uncharacterized protein n=1 Tax=Pythium insidiosum TaxID=114742 RepID=A0AAD5LCS8_PYTIN|nr:hypothetical protein P43SY_010119 [Pythium insidiosum]